MKTKTVKLSKKTVASVKAVVDAEQQRHRLQARAVKIGEQLVTMTLQAGRDARTDAMKAGLKLGSKVWFFGPGLNAGTVRSLRMSGFAHDIMIGRGHHGVPEPVVMVRTLDNLPPFPILLRKIYLKKPSMRLWDRR